jgi:hypothetical protein
MKAPVITLANAFHHENPAVRLSFDKDFGIIGQSLRHETSKATEIYTHFTEDSFKKFKNPLDEII